jgi:hypothetical protein
MRQPLCGGRQCYFHRSWRNTGYRRQTSKPFKKTIRDIIMEFESLNKQTGDLESWRNEFHQRRDIHNSCAPCRYEHGDAEQCDWFVREARYLNDERDRIDGRVKETNDRAHAARSRLAAQASAIRIATRQRVGNLRLSRRTYPLRCPARRL